jgi:UDP-N-acetyl-2-amino-2-deoxyglucuronate dehydrogenase
LSLDGEEFEFSEGFTDLHTIVYKEILAGNGYGLDDARASIELVHELREAAISAGTSATRHPMLSTLR